MADYDETDRRLAWEMHVELATRVTAVEPTEGALLSEALSSLHSVFGFARRALRERPVPRGRGADSVHAIVVRLLNNTLRPVLSRWHPALLAYEATRPPGAGQLEHERAWERYPALRAELAELRLVLREVAAHLADIADATSLVPDDEQPSLAGGSR